MTAPQVTFESNYVHIRHEPGVSSSADEVRDALLRAIELCGAHGFFRILAEADEPLHHLTREAVEAFVQRLAFIPGLKVACCFRRHTPDAMSQYYIDLARQHGTSVRFFTDSDEALRWLGAR
jgi:hypothetical protein